MIDSDSAVKETEVDESSGQNERGELSQGPRLKRKARTAHQMSSGRSLRSC